MSNRILFLMLIVAIVQTFSVDGQSTIGLDPTYDANVRNFAAEMQYTILHEMRHIKNQVLVCNDKCPALEELLGLHLNNMTEILQNFSIRIEALGQNFQEGRHSESLQVNVNNSQIEDLLSRHLNNMTQTFQSFSNKLQALDQNVRNATEFSEGLQLKFQNLSKLYEEQVKILQSVDRKLEEHDEYYRNQSAALTCVRQAVPSTARPTSEVSRSTTQPTMIQTPETTQLTVSSQALASTPEHTQPTANQEETQPTNSSQDMASTSEQTQPTANQEETEPTASLQDMASTPEQTQPTALQEETQSPTSLQALASTAEQTQPTALQEETQSPTSSQDMASTSEQAQSTPAPETTRPTTQ